MKKKLLLTLTVLGAFVFVGCKGKKTTKNTTKNTTKTNITTSNTTKETKTRKEIKYEAGNRIKHNLEYDEKGNILSHESSYRYSEDKEYKYYYKETFTYDNKGNKTNSIYYVYDEEGQKWDQMYSNEYTYESNTLIQHLVFEWNSSTNSWDKDIKRTYVFEGNIKKSETSYKLEGNEFVESFRWDYEYNTNGLMTEWKSYIYEDGEFVLKMKQSFEYYPNGAKTIISYDYKDSTFIEKEKEEYIYSMDLLQETYILSEKNGSNWDEISRSYHEYDEHHNIILTIEYEKNGSEYIEDYKCEAIIDEGNIIGNIEYNYDTDDSVWVKRFKIVFIEDSFGNQTPADYYKWNGTDWIED